MIQGYGDVSKSNLEALECDENTGDGDVCMADGKALESDKDVLKGDRVTMKSKEK